MYRFYLEYNYATLFRGTVHACVKMCKRTQEEMCALNNCCSEHFHNIFKLVTTHFRTDFALTRPPKRLTQ